MRKRIVIITVFLILIPIFVNARYLENLKVIKGTAEIAEPIFEVENDEMIKQEINKESNIEKYSFSVRNYKENEERVSEVDLKYQIEIINEGEGFPVKVVLREKNKQEDILNEKGKTEKILMDKNKKIKKDYELIVTWDEMKEINKKEENIRILINSEQVK